MKARVKERKGILAKLIEKGIAIFLQKECKTIKNININIYSTNREIIKGEINKMIISAEQVNYKELLFNKIKLQTNKLKLNYQVINKKLNFKDSFPVKVKVSLTGESLKKVLNSQNWYWVGNLISDRLLNSNQLTDINIKNNMLELEGSNKNKTNNNTELIQLKSEKGKIHMRNINNQSFMIIPIEDKIYINHINIIENKINIYAHSEVSI